MKNLETGNLISNKIKNIIILGVDKTGKSTLVDSILQEFPNINYFKGNKTDTPIEALEAACSYVSSSESTNPTILDRFHFPDDLVYAPVLNNKPLSDPIIKAYFKWVYARLIEQGTIFIYCYASTDIIEERFKQEEETLVRPYMIKDLKDYYDAALEILKIDTPILKLNSTDLTQLQMKEQALEFIKSNL